MAGVYQSSDGGRSWSPTSVRDTMPFCEVIAASPDFARDQTLYVGGRNGLYRSNRGGAAWRQVLLSASVQSLAVSRGLLLVGTGDDGILRSEDSGNTFAGANAGLIDLSVLALALSPEFERDATGFAATGSGLYRTRNGAKSWRPLDVDAAVQCLCFSPRFAEDRLVLAGTESDGLLRSDDAGAHWESLSELPARSITALAVSNEFTVVATTELGIAISHDGGSTWGIADAALGSVLTLAFVESDGGEALLAGLHRDGAARAVAPFDDWAMANAGLHARLLLGLALSPAFEHGQAMFATGPDDGVLVSDDGGRTWTAHLAGPEDPAVFAIAVSADRTLFASTEAGVLRSSNAGATWQLVTEPGLASVVAAGPRSLWVGQANGQLLTSDDRGESWRTVRDSFDAAIVSVACAPDGTLFVGTVGGGTLTVWRSRDVGLQWERWLVEPGEDLLPLAVSAGYAIDERVYVGVGRRVLTPMRNTREVRAGEQRPMWRDVNLGATSTGIAVPPAAEVSNVVFVATSAGIHVSRDGGEHFARWLDGDGPSATVAVAVSPDYPRDRLVYALEVGGAIWRRRDAD
jgi:photosystem II stability/assembly factor-like uncharacterized protein